MATVDRDRRRRVLVPQALGSNEFLRVTWHADRGLVVFSQWEDDRCVAAIPVRVGDLAELAELTSDAIAGPPAPAWPPPAPESLVVPADGFALPLESRIA